MGAGGFLILDPKIMKLADLTPVEEISARHVEFFDPPSDVLYKRIGNGAGLAFLKRIIDEATKSYEENPEYRLTHWGKELGPAALEIIGKMTSLIQLHGLRSMRSWDIYGGRSKIDSVVATTLNLYDNMTK
jgi:hypothetical protein